MTRTRTASTDARSVSLRKDLQIWQGNKHDDVEGRKRDTLEQVLLGFAAEGQDWLRRPRRVRSCMCMLILRGRKASLQCHLCIRSCVSSGEESGIDLVRIQKAWLGDAPRDDRSGTKSLLGRPLQCRVVSRSQLCFWPQRLALNGLKAWRRAITCHLWKDRQSQTTLDAVSDVMLFT